MPDPSASPDSALSAPLQPAPSAEAAIVVGEDDIRFTRGPRSYRVRGLSRNLSAESLKVTLRVSAGDHLHLDTLDLYQARGRYAFAKGAALALGVAAEVMAGDLSALVLALEPLQEAAIRGALTPDGPSDEAGVERGRRSGRPRAVARSGLARTHCLGRGSDRRGRRGDQCAGVLPGDGLAFAGQAAGDPDPVHQRGRQVDLDGCAAVLDARIASACTTRR